MEAIGDKVAEGLKKVAVKKAQSELEAQKQRHYIKTIVSEETNRWEEYSYRSREEVIEELARQRSRLAYQTRAFHREQSFLSRKAKRKAKNEILATKITIQVFEYLFQKE